MSKLPGTVVLLVVTFLLAGTLEAQGKRLKKVDNRQFLELARTHSAGDVVLGYSSKEGRIAYYRTKEGAEGLVVLSADYTKVRGYEGPTSMVVVLDREGRVVKAAVVQSLDTPEYVTDIEQAGFLGRFAGAKVGTEVQVDAVAGATVTAQAMSRTVSNTLKALEPLFKCLVFSQQGLSCADPSRRFLPLGN
jgi:Na+-translocating ferredoxin:NAD+ oxidoreductase RnfG subunit